MKDFDLFQKYFLKYQKSFGLTGYMVYFKHEPLEGEFASITIDSTSMVVSVYLNSELPEKEKPFKDIKRDAKHEAIHLLTGRLHCLAKSRHVSSAEISEAEEDLVNRIGGLLD